MGSGRGPKRIANLAITAAIGIGALLGAATASANTVLHVDAVHGHNTGNCQAAPCQTLGYAVAQGRLVPDLITIQAGPGTYIGDVALGAADSGLTIVGAGSGPNPARSTIVRGVAGNATFNTTTAGLSSSLSLAHLRIVNPAADSSAPVLGSSTNLGLNDVQLIENGTGSGLVDNSADVTLVKSPITLAATGGGSPAIGGGSLALTLSSSPITVKGTGGAVANGGAPVTVISSPIKLQNASGAGYAVANGAGPVTVMGSAITVSGTGGGIANGGAPVTVTNSPITLGNSSGAGYAISNGGAAVTVSGSRINVNGSGGAVANGGAPVTVSNSPITLQTPTGTGYAITNGGAAVSVSHSAIVVHGKGGAIANGGAPIVVTSSPVSLLNAAGVAYAITNGGAAVSISNSAIVVHGTGGGIANGGGPITLSSSPVTLTNTTGGGIAIVNGGADVRAQASNIDVKGAGGAVTNGGGSTILSNLTVTMDKATSSSPALVMTGRGSSLSHVSVHGAWRGTAVIDAGSLTIADSALTSGAAPTSPLVILSDGASFGRSVSIQRSRLTQHSSTIPNVTIANADLSTSSSAVLGGSSALSLAASGGVGRLLTIVSSTIDAGALGTRGGPSIRSVVASADNTVGSVALVNVEGSILLEAPAATRGGTNGKTTVNCTHSEVPSTTQLATATLGVIHCPAGAEGNTSTSSLAAIFAAPVTHYRLNPHWSGVDSVPSAAISLPFPFTDSPTDLLGNPRAVNGRGTCTPGVRDKGAIELTGHGGVVPKPVISGPALAFRGVPASFTGRAPNLPATIHPSFSWHSSDGASAAGPTFTHRFQRAGRTTIILTARGAIACAAVATRKVTVYGPDRLSQLRLSRRTFKAASSGGSTAGASTGTTVSYHGSAPARTSFTILRRVHGHLVKVGTFKHRDRPGRVRFHFTGRVGGHALAGGAYELKATPSNPAGKGRAVSVSFAIKG